MTAPPDFERRALLAGGLALGTGASSAAAAPLDAQALRGLEALIDDAIQSQRIPGALLWVERDGVAWHIALGQRAVEPRAEALDASTIFDAASLTKPVVTTTLVMQALERGAIAVDDPLQRHLPAFEGGEAIRLRHLLTHCSGLPAVLPLEPSWTGRDAAIALACRARPTHAPGEAFRYSDVNFILLGAMLERLAGTPLQEQAWQSVLQPLGMQDSGYLPLRRHPAQRIAPTQWEGAQMLRGEVHDPTARRMGGVAGHAGLFSTLPDLARFARWVLATPGTMRMTAVASPSSLTEKRGLGWDVDSPFSRPRGKGYPVGSFGHTGFTGCAMWIDRGSRSFYVLLSNRVHPKGGPSIVPLYEQVATLAALAVGLLPPAQ